MQKLKKDEFDRPPVLHNKAGEERKAGIELEYAAVNLEKTAEIISTLFGGSVRRITTFEFKVEDTDFGEFKFELDAQLLLQKKYESFLKKIGIDISELKKKKELEELLSDMASTIVPFEIVTPPIPFSKLYKVDELVSEMRNNHAEGTGTSFFHAFGMHLNPEIPDVKPETILRTLQSFILLQEWIRLDSEIDLSRRITPYIDDFKKEYKLLILQKDYKPDINRLMDDYLEHNPTRNRPLDLLPVFEFVDENKVQAVVDDGLTSPRPAFHYRLPNCRIDEPEWSVASEWNRWVLVEKLASDYKTLSRLKEDYTNYSKESSFGFKGKWIRHVYKWVYEVRN